jgi:hypothetical protein
MRSRRRRQRGGGRPVRFQNSATAADQWLSRRGLVLDQAAEDRSTSDPAVDRLGGRALPGVAGAAAVLDAADACCSAQRRSRARRRCCSPKISIWSVSSVRTSTQAIGEAVRSRASRRDLDDPIACIGSTASNDAVNCPARSRRRNRKRATCWPRSMTRLRPVGWSRVRGGSVGGSGFLSTA